MRKMLLLFLFPFHLIAQESGFRAYKVVSLYQRVVRFGHRQQDCMGNE